MPDHLARFSSGRNFEVHGRTWTFFFLHNQLSSSFKAQFILVITVHLIFAGSNWASKTSGCGSGGQYISIYTISKVQPQFPLSFDRTVISGKNDSYCKCIPMQGHFYSADPNTLQCVGDRPFLQIPKTSVAGLGVLAVHCYVAGDLHISTSLAQSSADTMTYLDTRYMARHCR